LKRKTLELAQRIAETVSSWEGVEAVTLNEAAEGDMFDPNFALALDVYHVLPLPPPEARLSQYGRADVYESTQTKDRFLLGDVPVHIEFKWTKSTETMVQVACGKKEAMRVLSGAGTYGYYRLTEGYVLFSRGEWLSDLKKKLATLGRDFWTELRGVYQSKMEHYLSDLGAALLSDDNFYFLVSSAGFIKTAALTLFCINRRFEPSYRFYYPQVCSLQTLPDSFDAQIETFLSSSAEVTMERKYGVAQVIARGVLAL
jgi:hypothetical protein